MAHLDAYIRVSKVAGRSGDSFISPELQRQQIEEYAKRHGHTLTIHDPELDVSGGKMRRAILDQVLARIRSGQTDGMIVAKLNRFARTLIGGLVVLDQIKEMGAVLVTVAEDIDFSTRSGRLQGNILLSIAQDELDRYREEWADAQRHAIENGVYTASAVPKGYDKDDHRRLIPNADAPTIKLAYKMRGEGRSLREIGEMLSEKLPESAWTNQMVERLFTTRVYRGELIRDKLKNAKAHKPLVSEREWQLANNGVKKRAERTKQENLLTGVIRCAACSHTMTPTYSTTKGGRIPVYKCRGAKHSYGKCPAPSSITRARVDAYVEQAWREQMADVQIVGTRDSRVIDTAAQKVADAEEELRTFAGDLTARKALGPQMYAEAMESRSAALQEAQRGLQEAMAENGGDAPTLDSYDAASVSDKREMIAATLDAVFVRRGAMRAEAPDRVLIRWHGELKHELPGRGRRIGQMPAPVEW